MRHLVAVAAFLALAITGCAPVTPVDIGGSKADGTVTTGATVGIFDTVNWEGADEMALYRCRQWGYSHAEPFTGIRERCLDSYCETKELSRTYQCID